ncbi:MAG: hypothetical protein WCK17_06540 [Verrucomicrobiota bacterium]
MDDYSELSSYCHCCRRKCYGVHHRCPCLDLSSFTKCAQYYCRASAAGNRRSDASIYATNPKANVAVAAAPSNGPADNNSFTGSSSRRAQSHNAAANTAGPETAMTNAHSEATATPMRSELLRLSLSLVSASLACP